LIREIEIKKNGYIPPDANEDGLDATVPPPLREHIEPHRINLAIELRYKRKVYTREEVNGGWLFGIIVTTMDLQTVDTVLVDSLWRVVQINQRIF
jgi:hypothetical protein